MLKILSVCAALSFLLGVERDGAIRRLRGGYQKSLRQHRTWKPPHCHLPQGACHRPFRRVQGKIGRARGGWKNMPRGRRKAMRYRTSAHPESGLHRKCPLQFQRRLQGRSSGRCHPGDQGSKTVAAQMLLNPVAGSEATFLATWLTTYELLPKMMNVYVLVDPSKGKGPRSDRTAIAVIGIDQGGNKYLIDGYCHRMKLSERWHRIKTMKAKWEADPGVKMVRIGYEQYGMVDDISAMKEMMRTEGNYFEIVELRTPETGGHSKRQN